MSQTQHQNFDTQPLYNIKAVAKATGLSAATLRAWERRYGALTPERTTGGYRLYSARDIALLRWLKARVDEGMSISQAFIWLNQSKVADGGWAVSPQARPEASDLAHARVVLLEAFDAFDEVRAEQVLEEAFALYGVDIVAEHVIGRIEDVWHSEHVSPAVEHFASNFLQRKLAAIISAGPSFVNRPLVVLGCAPGEWRELGLLLIHLQLRRRGIHTVYLGQNVPVADFAADMARLQPALAVIAATSEQTVDGLIALAQTVEALPAPRPLFGYTGRIFNVQPALRAAVPGAFLGESARAAVTYVAALIAQRHPDGMMPDAPAIPSLAD